MDLVGDRRACPLLGPMIAFLVVLPVAVLDRWISGAKASSGPSGARAGPFRADCRDCTGIIAVEIILIGMGLKSDPQPDWDAGWSGLVQRGAPTGLR